jgi:hypothetical protein
MAGRPLRRARLFAEVQARTGGGIPETWGIVAAELAAQASAVRALLEHHGDVRAALRAIAPDTASLSRAEQQQVAERIFGDAILARLRRELRRVRRRLMRTMIDTVLASPRANPEMTVRAFDALARVGGWYAKPTAQRPAPPKTVPPPPSLYDSVDGALALMAHEPGPAVATPPDESLTQLRFVDDDDDADGLEQVRKHIAARRAAVCPNGHIADAG